MNLFLPWSTKGEILKLCIKEELHHLLLWGVLSSLKKKKDTKAHKNYLGAIILFFFIFEVPQ
jgi:hypothetical protein